MTGGVIFSLSPGIACGITGRSIVVPCPAVSAPGPPAAVNTRAPGIELTALVSIERIRPCGMTERTNVACSTPGRSTSSPNVAVPVMKRGSSLRVTRLPRMLMGRDPTDEHAHGDTEHGRRVKACSHGPLRHVARPPEGAQATQDPRRDLRRARRGTPGRGPA